MAMTAEPFIQQQEIEMPKVAETSPSLQDEVVATAIANQVSSENNINDDQICSQEDQKHPLDAEQEKKRFNLFKKPKNFALFSRSKTVVNDEVYAAKEAAPKELPQIRQMDPIQVGNKEEQQDDGNPAAVAAATVTAIIATTEPPDAFASDIKPTTSDHEQEADENRSPKRISFLSRLLAKKKTTEPAPKDEDTSKVTMTTAGTEQEMATAESCQELGLETEAAAAAASTASAHIEEEVSAVKEKGSPSSPTFGRRLTSLFGKKSAKKRSEEPTMNEKASNSKTEAAHADQVEPPTTTEIVQDESPEQGTKKDEHEPKNEEDERAPAVASISNKEITASA